MIRFPLSVLASGLALGLALSLSACGSSDEDPRAGPPLVRIATMRAASGGTRSYSGTVSARVQSDLGFRVPGKIIERLVETGQTVRRGQPLMRIDRTDPALASIAQAGGVEAARARAIQTAADERRYRDLVAAGAISASAYDQIKAAADAARAQLRAAEAQARVAANEADYTVLRADADGVIVETLAEPGQVVAAGQPVVRLARSGAREALISLPETVRPSLGSTARALLFNGAQGNARLRQLSDAADPLTRTYQARFVLDGAAASAPLGSTVTIELGNGGTGGAAEIPLAAIHDAGKGPGVWIIAGKEPHVEFRPVRIAKLGEETATIVSGLRPGEQFVSLGAHLLHQGERVRTGVGAAK